MNDHIPDVTKMISYVAPVFPTPAGVQHNDGMTIRDYFAAAALQGLLSSIEPNQLWCGEDVAVVCYRTADALLRAREVKP